MKLLKFVISLFFVCAFLMPLDGQAQTKKRSGSAKTSTSRTSSSRKTSGSSSSASVSAAKLKGKKYLFTMDGGGFDMSVQIGFIEFTTDTEFEFESSVDDTTQQGKWSLSGSNLTLTITSTGKTLFAGKVGANIKKITGRGDGKDLVLYDVTAPKTTPSVSEIKKAILGGTYFTLLDLFLPGEKIPCLLPATIKFTPTDANSGTFKITGKSEIFTLAGVLKGSYRFEGDNIYLSGFDGEEYDTSMVENSNHIYVELGEKYIKQMGKLNLGIDFIK